MLLHYQRFLVAGVSFVAIWYAALLQQQQQQQQEQNGGSNPSVVSLSAVLISYAPLWLIVAIGLYAVGSVLYGTLTFHDTPEAAQELEWQIQEAKKEMTKRGVINKEEENEKL